MDLHLTSGNLSERTGGENDSDVVESTANSNGDSDTPIIKRFRFRAVFTLDPIPAGNESIFVWDNSISARFTELLNSRAKNQDNQQLPQSLAAYLTMTSLNTTIGYLKSLSLMEDAASEDINIYEQMFLAALPGPKSFQFILDIEHPPDQVQFTGNNLKVTKLADGSYELEIWMDIQEKLGIQWKEIGRMTNGSIIGLTLEVDESAVCAVDFGRMTNGSTIGLPLELDDSAVCAVDLGKMALLKLFPDKFNFGNKLFVRWSEMLLNGDIGSDLVIKVGDKAIRLHKSILSGRSPVLKALLKEKENNCAHIFGDMSEVGVKALVKFIYSWDLGEAWKSCDITLELLKAGIQFEMEDLTDAMEQLICFMPFNWFSLEMVTATQRLVDLIRALQDGEKLREAEKKCLDFWKWHSSNKCMRMWYALGPHPTFWDETSSSVECHLVKKGILTFRSGPVENEFSSWFRLNLIPGVTIEKRSNIFWANLLLAQDDDKVNLQRILCTDLKVYLKIGEQRNTGNLKVLIDEDQSSVNLFEELAKFSPNCYGFNLVIVVNWYPKASAIRRLVSNETNLKVEKFEDGKFGLELTEIDVGEVKSDGLDKRFSAQFSLTLALDEGIGNELNWMEFVKHGLNKWSRMLQNGLTIPTDLVIRAGDTEKNGEGVKCHKFVLSERSPVFKVMLEVDMMEGRSGCVEIGDMTEAGVKAMLLFVYGWDLEGAWSDCGVALELLEAGHKYQMEDLVEAMVGVVGAMSFDWFRKDVVEEMAKFAGMVGGKLEKVGKKCLAVLKWFDDRKTDTLMEAKE